MSRTDPDRRPAVLDHLAIGVERWTDGYERFAVELGGRWSHGGESGPMAPCQLVYQHGMRLELIAPNGPDGFMRRFIDRHGPGAHHLTFNVASLDDMLAGVARLGIDVLGGRTSMPFWQEAFLHPRLCGVGTLLQLVQKDESHMAELLADFPTPPGFPTQQQEQRSVAWIGLTAESLAAARTLFAGVLRGDVVEHDKGWMLLTWGIGRSLLVRDASATPGGPRLWAGAPTPGVAHILMGPPNVRPRDLARSGPTQPRLAQTGRTAAADTVRVLPHDAGTRTPVWLIESATVAA